MKVLEVIKGFGIELNEEQQSAVMKAVGEGYVLRSDYNSLNTNYKKLKGERNNSNSEISVLLKQIVISTRTIMKNC